ncbi:MAG: uracil-DNA glycosylase [Candidatus Cloacimonas sp.]|nr:uracil-DNA glycosylase [Candidatus Cloacimonadota bacterium]
MKSRAFNQYLELLATSGIEEIKKTTTEETITDIGVTETTTEQDPVAFLKSREETCRSCTKCVLHRDRINSVYGEGNPRARMMIIGEAPGRDENLKGKPFVGRAGQLLTKMLQAINIERDEVYIANTVKCQPPRNRNPLPDEVAACIPYLKEQIEVIKPDLIMLLGKVAASSILGANDSMGNLREGTYEFQGIPTYVTYHPAALLYSPKLKRFAWEDLQKIRDIYNAK